MRIRRGGGGREVSCAQTMSDALRRVSGVLIIRGLSESG